jgi:hypothetical protein
MGMTGHAGKIGGQYMRPATNGTRNRLPSLASRWRLDRRLAPNELPAMNGKSGLRDPDHAASEAPAGIANRLRLQVVRFFVHDDAAADNRFLAAHRHHAVSQLKMRLACTVGVEIAHISFMALLGIMTGVRIVRRVEMAAGRLAIRRRAIAKLMNVESVFAWTKSGDIGNDFYFVARFREGHNSFNVAAFGRVQHSDGFGRFLRQDRNGEEGKRARGQQPQCSTEKSVRFHWSTYDGCDETKVAQREAKIRTTRPSPRRVVGVTGIHVIPIFYLA